MRENGQQNENLKNEMERYMRVHIDEDRAEALDLKQ